MSLYEAYEDNQCRKKTENVPSLVPDGIPPAVRKKKERVLINHKIIEERFKKSLMNQSYSFPRHED